MSAPNVIQATTMYCKTAVQLVLTTATAIISNPAGSGKVMKVNMLMIGNQDLVSSYKLTAEIYNGTTSYKFCPIVGIPPNSALDVLSKNLYLEEGQSLRLTADAVSKLEAIASYEEIF